MNSSHKENKILIKKGEVLFKDGEECDFLYLVHTGKIGLFKLHKNRVVPIQKILPSEVVGVSSSILNKCRSASAITLEDSVVSKIRVTDIQSAFDSGPSWVKEMFQTMALRLDNLLDVLNEHHIGDEGILEEIELRPDILAMVKKKLMQ